MTKRRDWIKVRKDWWESPSHRLISPGARFFGVYLLYLADSDPDWRETGVGRLVGPSGVALRSEDVARLVGVRSRDGRRWVSELLSCGTLHETDDGMLFFPNYREHQEDRSSKHKRKARKADDSHQGCHQVVNVEEEEEAEEEVEADLSSPTVSSKQCDQSPSGDSETRRKSRKVKDLVDPLWDWFESECVERGFARKAKGLSNDERGKISTGILRHIRSTLGLGNSREDTDRVVATMRAHLEWKLDQAEHDRNSRKYIRTVSPWRRKSFDYWWAYVVDSTEPTAPTGREPQTPEEADAYCKEHGKYPKGWTFKRGEWVRK